MFTADVLTGASGKQSMIVSLDDFFPECRSLTQGTSLPRLSCWITPGSCQKSSFSVCMRTLVTRGYKIFTEMPELELIVFHWDVPDKDGPDGIRKWGLVFDRDEDKEMKISILNKWAVDSIEKRLGKKFCISFE